ncbi:hypothetical protein A9Q99_27350 [Gammaproteobacteria bacterium 45_16_T64]|nr:hypothetical protein A9Q99_27350 [Gammaproteobacteria bacterium 45_16_T64]
MEKIDNDPFQAVSLVDVKRFLALYRAKNQTKAARGLGIHQTSMTYTLKKFEELFGEQLFRRDGQNLHPNDMAKKVYESLKQIESILGGLLYDDSFSHFKNGQKTAFKISGDGYFHKIIEPSLTESLINGTNSDFILDYEYEGDVEKGIEKVASRTVDLFVTSRFVPPEYESPLVQSCNLMKDEWVGAVSPIMKAQFSEAELSELCFAVPSQLYRCFQKEVTGNVVVYSDSTINAGVTHRADVVSVLPGRVAKLDWMDLRVLSSICIEIPSKMSVRCYWATEKLKGKQKQLDFLRKTLINLCQGL